MGEYVRCCSPAPGDKDEADVDLSFKDGGAGARADSTWAAALRVEDDVPAARSFVRLRFVSFSTPPTCVKVNRGSSSLLSGRRSSGMYMSSCAAGVREVLGDVFAGWSKRVLARVVVACGGRLESPAREVCAAGVGLFSRACDGGDLCPTRKKGEGKEKGGARGNVFKKGANGKKREEQRDP